MTTVAHEVSVAPLTELMAVNCADAVLETSNHRPARSRYPVVDMVDIFGRCFWHETTLRSSHLSPNSV
jgi:hypothetical protein